MRLEREISTITCGIYCIMSFDINNLRIGVIGLGYVGLPLAVEFGKQFSTCGFDVKADRIAALEKGVNSTLEELKKASLRNYGTVSGQEV